VVREGRFVDRADAGRALAGLLTRYAGRPDVLVLALPRGGVPVGLEVATALRAPLDVLVVRKLGVPAQPELAFGAVASGGLGMVNPDIVNQARIDEATIETVTARERREIVRRESAYRAGGHPAPVTGKAAIVVDDGLATGSTMRVAVAALRRLQPQRVVVAVPVAPPSVCAVLEREADEVVCLLTPSWLGAVGAWYADFAQVSDDEVRALLAQAEASSGRTDAGEAADDDAAHA
jgi:predicted phosphoribosyltransferase